MNTSPNLTKNQAMVYQALSDAKLPLTAYTILDDLREQGFRAPPQVYRALEKLQEMGLVHRLESLNAFVACRHTDCQSHDFIAFAICDTCGEAVEIAQKSLEDEILSLTKTYQFKAIKTSVEIRGICQSCTALTSNAHL
jgi:Fur family transcriptional regulator, zinc uptake regulator